MPSLSSWSCVLERRCSAAQRVRRLSGASACSRPSWRRGQLSLCFAAGSSPCSRSAIAVGCSTARATSPASAPPLAGDRAVGRRGDRRTSEGRQDVAQRGSRTAGCERNDMKPQPCPRGSLPSSQSSLWTTSTPSGFRKRARATCNKQGLAYAVSACTYCSGASAMLHQHSDSVTLRLSTALVSVGKLNFMHSDYLREGTWSQIISVSSGLRRTQSPLSA